MSLFRLPDKEPLAEVDPALAARLAALLVQTLQDELATPEPEALRLADAVTWTVTRERDGLWLTLAHGAENAIGIGAPEPARGRQREHHLVPPLAVPRRLVVLLPG